MDILFDILGIVVLIHHLKVLRSLNVISLKDKSSITFINFVTSFNVFLCVCYFQFFFKSSFKALKAISCLSLNPTPRRVIVLNNLVVFLRDDDSCCCVCLLSGADACDLYTNWFIHYHGCIGESRVSNYYVTD